jgi:hypothetical protein
LEAVVKGKHIMENVVCLQAYAFVAAAAVIIM